MTVDNIRGIDGITERDKGELVRQARIPQVAQTPLKGILALDPQFPWETLATEANRLDILSPCIRWNMVRHPVAPFEFVLDGEILHTGFEGYMVGMEKEEAYDLLWGLAQGAKDAILSRFLNSWRTDQFTRVMNIITNPHCPYKEVWTVLPFAEELFLGMIDAAREEMRPEARVFRKQNGALAEKAKPIQYEKTTMKQTLHLPTRPVTPLRYVIQEPTPQDRQLLQFVNTIGGVGHPITRTLLEKGVLGDYRRKISG